MTASVDASVVERAFVRGGVDAEREPRHDRQARVDASARANSRAFALPLRRRVAAADDRERGLVQELATPDEEQHRRRVADIEQGARIVARRPRRLRDARVVEPARRCAERFLRDRCERGFGDRRRHVACKLRQRMRRGSRTDRRTPAATSPVRVAAKPCARASPRQAIAGRPPSGHRTRGQPATADQASLRGEAGRARAAARSKRVRQAQGVRTKSPMRTASVELSTIAYDTRSNTRNTIRIPVRSSGTFR